MPNVCQTQVFSFKNRIESTWYSGEFMAYYKALASSISGSFGKVLESEILYKAMPFNVLRKSYGTFLKDIILNVSLMGICLLTT